MSDSHISSGSSRVRPFRLNRETLADGVRVLVRRDLHLAKIVTLFGLPPLWPRPASFATLVHIILEQQVSLASANAAFARLKIAASPLTPERFLSLDARKLKRIGFSRQKTLYCRLLAAEIGEGRLKLPALARMDDAAARQTLMRIKGIGVWTADIYLMEALGRRDIWPVGDIALATAVQVVKGLPARPTPEELESLGEPWRPWRAVAARMFWHYYLSTPPRRKAWIERR
ncbi:MAG: DNA-3-methyladenine glycosylase 2 family protein [Chloroflexi bacterium]|nr:DNA-3-methyladenine glycosylase 2 family protein [Chloroflexota bacterium]